MITGEVGGGRRWGTVDADRAKIKVVKKWGNKMSVMHKKQKKKARLFSHSFCICSPCSLLQFSSPDQQTAGMKKNIKKVSISLSRERGREGISIVPFLLQYLRLGIFFLSFKSQNRNNLAKKVNTKKNHKSQKGRLLFFSFFVAFFGGGAVMRGRRGPEQATVVPSHLGRKDTCIGAHERTALGDYCDAALPSGCWGMRG